MLVILIVLAYLGLASFGLIICRLAARSDTADALALAEWMASSQTGGESQLPAEGSPWGHSAPDEPYRAAG